MKEGTPVDMRRLVSELLGQKVLTYLTETPVGIRTLPQLHPPASTADLAGLEQRAGQRLEEHYAAFLSLTDGIEGFYFDMPILGCHEWQRGSNRTAAAHARLMLLLESGTPQDVGLPESTKLFPISVDGDRSRGIFMLDTSDQVPERFWWTGEGGSEFFGTFSDLMGYELDRRSYTPRETVD